MQTEDLKNLSQSGKLKEKLEILFSLEGVKNKYRASQAILEYINVSFLTKYKKIKLDNYNIINIILSYQEIDDNLYNLMLDVNALYNRCDEKGVTTEKIEDLLFKIDNIYKIIKDKYGDIE